MSNDLRGGVAPVLKLTRTAMAPGTGHRAPGLHPSSDDNAARHTAASLAASAGANLKAVQRMLGYAKASMTLDVYANLFDEDLDGAADRLDAAIKSTADGLRNESRQSIP